VRLLNAYARPATKALAGEAVRWRTSRNIAHADSARARTTATFEARTALPVAQKTGATINASGSR
jgi:hypothetical protein